MSVDTAMPAAELQSAGLDQRAVAEWIAAAPKRTGDYFVDRPRYSRYWQLGADLLGRLPKKPARKCRRGARGTVHPRSRARTARAFPRGPRRDALRRADAPTLAIYSLGRPGLRRGHDRPRPDADRSAGRRRGRALARREGRRRDRPGHFSRARARQRNCRPASCATPCCCRGRRPPSICKNSPPTAASILARLSSSAAARRSSSRRRTSASSMPRTTPRSTPWRSRSIVAILDAKSDIAVLRGGEVEHPKYRGRRLFGAGINLTHLYRGQIPFVWFLRRDLGFVHKFFRGVARPELLPDDVHGTAIEKPWIAAVDGFAIGGHCQILLTMDYVLAASRRVHDAAGAQGRHHSGCRQLAPAALHRRPHRPPGDPIRAQARLRQPGGPFDLRRDRARRRDGRARSIASSPA